MPQIDESLWELLSKYAPNLERLHLDNMPAVIMPKKKRLTALLQRLKELKITNCPQIINDVDAYIVRTRPHLVYDFDQAVEGSTLNMHQSITNMAA